MRFTMTFVEEDYERLVAHLFHSSSEEAAYLLCGISRTRNETRLLVREVTPVTADEIDHSSKAHMQIKQASFLRAIKAAADRNQCFAFVHSHPCELSKHSDQDDATEKPLFRTAYNRIRDANAVHSSLVFSAPDNPVGRVWLPDGSHILMERIRVVGKRFRFAMDLARTDIRLNLFSRQILAFGEELQRLLQQLTIGIVGMGGTGTAVAEQLVRLGVGRLITADVQALEESNVTRVYGSRIRDAGTHKVGVFHRHSDDIGIGTTIEAIPGNITHQAVIKRFRECDLIFGCTDREWGRSILTRFALYYLVPVFDIGVKVDSEDGNIKAIEARVTTLLPGAACLFCRGRISGNVIQAEVLQETDPAEYKRRREQEYVPELRTNAPAVIPFTTAIASFALNELLHRFSGHMGADRVSTELFLLFDDSRISTNSTASASACFCADRRKWGRGDADPFMDLTWGRQE
jgi:molybdopterin/thiamine biosynthesis adenylyltransferase